MTENPLDTIKKLDLDFFNVISQNRTFAYKDGVLSAKTKYLIAMAIDASHGATAGVTSLARQAINAGATKEEIAETLHVVNYISGVASIYTAANGLKDIF